MSSPLYRAWISRSPRERTVIVVLAAMLGVALYAWLVQAAGPARARLSTSVAALQAQAVRLDQQAAELGRLRAAPGATASATDLRALVQARIDAAGLARALVRIDAPDADQVVVVFGAVAFADWLGWIAGLQSQQVRLDAARLEALSAPGLVSATATLARPKQR
jgi:type II secretory pathway component PulM